MDAYEATRIVFSRIQNLDPENASKIMGLLLIQDHGEKEMIRLAFGPEALLHSVILKARKDLMLVPSSDSPSSSSKPNFSASPFLPSNPITISRQNSTSSRLGNSINNINNNIPPSLSIPSPSNALSSDLKNPEDLNNISPNNLSSVGSSSSSINSSSLPFYGTGGSTDMIDEFQLQDQLSFLNDRPPTLGSKNLDMFYPSSDLRLSPNGIANWGSSGSLYRRSCSVSDVCLGSDDPNCGFGWKPCLYYARGYCKNGTSCRFLHGGGLVDSSTGGGVMVDSDGSPLSALVGSPSKLEMMDRCHELLRSKSAHQQQRLSSSLLMAASANSFPYSPKCMNFLLQQQQSDTQRAAAAALMMGEDMHNFGRSRLERNEYSILGGGASIVNPASRQIYLTFPADSTFREEDVSNYFSIFGPVQDVRIPYQQKRMFGFVTFVYPETVKLILAKGNPHFVCEARVLVKPYKEKGKVPDKKLQQLEKGDFSPSGLDSREAYDLPLGTRMFYNTQDMLWRRKLEEQTDLQQALELQSRRLMSLQLVDLKKNHLRSLSATSPIPSPSAQSPNPFSQNLVFPSICQENINSDHGPAISVAVSSDPHQTLSVAAGKESTANGDNSIYKESSHVDRDNDLHESLEHNLPDSPFASPKKAAEDYLFAFSNAASETNVLDPSANNNTLTPSTLDMAASFKAFDCQMPRFSSGHGAIGMYAGTGGPTCPVGI